RTSDARGWRHLPAGRFLVSRKRGRLHLDGAVVPAMVWRYRASPRKVPDLQGLESTSSGRRRPMMLEIDQECLNREIEELARLSDGQAPGVTRIVFTATDLEARALLKDRCEKAGLAVRQDPIGNLFARWSGSDASALAIGTGSHIDAIPND